MTAALKTRRHSEDNNRTAKPESDRRAYHISEIPKSTVEAIKTSRMDSRHDHLNALLDQ